MDTARLIPIEAACIAAHLGDWTIGASPIAALERGLRLAASRFVPFPDAPANLSPAALFREAVTQCLAQTGCAPWLDGDARRRAVIDAFNAIDGGLELAGALRHLGPPAPDRCASSRPGPHREMYRRQGSPR